MQEKERLQIDNEKIKQTEKNIESIIEPSKSKIQLFKDELNKIKKSQDDVDHYLHCAKVYKCNRKTIEQYPNYYSEGKDVRKYGLLGKSSSELQQIIDIKEKESQTINNRENELLCSIKTENDIINECSKSSEKRSTNDKLILKIDSFLSSIDLQSIEKIDDSKINLIKNKYADLILNLKEVRNTIDKNNSLLFDFQNRKSLIDKRINEINIIINSPDLSEHPLYSGSSVC